MLWVHLIPRRLVGYVIAGGHSDSIDTKLYSIYSCGTVLDFHQSFPITSSGCSPLEPEFLLYRCLGGCGEWGCVGSVGTQGLGDWGTGGLGDTYFYSPSTIHHPLFTVHCQLSKSVSTLGYRHCGDNRDVCWLFCGSRCSAEYYC